MTAIKKSKLIKTISKFAFLPMLLYLVVSSIGIVMIFYPTLFSGFSLIQTDPGDTRLVNYFLEHSFQLIVNRDYVGELWSPAFFYPYEKVLAFSENLFGAAPIYWLFRAVVSFDLAFQLWAIAVCILNFASFAILLRKYRVGHILCALGAFLFAFSIPRMGQLAHPQLLPQFFTPIAFWIVWNFVKQPTRKRLALFLLLTYLQLLAGVYLGWFLLFSLLIFFGVAYPLDREARRKILSYWRSDYKAIIGITLGWVVLTVLTFWPYLEAKAKFGSRPYSEVDLLLPRISSWFTVPPGSLWSPLLAWVSKDLPLVWEHSMFAGLVLIVLTGLSIYTIFYFKDALNHERALLVKVCLLVFIVLFCLSLRLPSGLSLWKLIYTVVPGASVIRGVTRIWLIAYFYLIIAAIVACDSLVRTAVTKKRWRLLIISILCVIGISEQLVLNGYSYEKAPLAKETTEIRDLMKQDCTIAYLSSHPAKPFIVDHLSAMWAGIEANVPVVNGYSGLIPPQYGDISKAMSVPQLVGWFETFKKESKGRLCMIYPSSVPPEDILLSTHSVAKRISSSGAFTSYTIQLPVAKVFSQEIRFFDYPKTVKPNSEIKIPVIVKNTSNFFWSPKSAKPTHFSYRWIDSNGKLAVFDGDGDRTPLPYELSPGESLALNATIRTPNTPGKYKLILTMVQEAVAWFNDKTTNYPKLDIDVVSP